MIYDDDDDDDNPYNPNFLTYRERQELLNIQIPILVTKPDPECPICINIMNLSFRSPVTCGKCNYIACHACYRIYLLNHYSLSHCMKCDATWDRQHMMQNFRSQFINTDYKNHKEKILFEIEKSKFMDAQPHVEREIRRRQLHTSRTIVIRPNIEQEQRRVFVKKCTCTDCLGFISSKWICGICLNYYCPACHEVIGTSKTIPHTCDSDTLATIKLLDADTKSCPTCSIIR
jgi:hypothetical protein